ESVRDAFYKLQTNIDNIPHAFLFAGPRGSGKTSAARILAKIVNCENPKKVDGKITPCNKCSQCKAIESGQSMDVIEMDAASNRGIDDIRAIRDSVKLSPAQANKKIYILDEAHMLTLDAANAFLKTLEEPPAHVIFILATTDPHKLPETVRSRLTTIQFKKATAKEIERQIERVARKEKLKLGAGVIDLISQVSDGSFRDAVKLLEELATGGGEIALESATEMIMGKSTLCGDKFFDALARKDIKTALEMVENATREGVSIKNQTQLIITRLQSALLVKNGLDGDDIDTLTSAEIVDLLECILDTQKLSFATTLEQLPLELALSKWTGSAKKEVKEDTGQTSKKKLKNVRSMSSDNSHWTQILDHMRGKNTSIETLLRAATPMGIDGNIYKVGVCYRFHKERLETNQYRSMLEGVVSEVIGIKPVKVECFLTEKKAEAPAPRQVSVAEVGLTQAGDNSIIQAAKEIFGQ
ncbi:DNA polymerase III subunit gamma/tau, partial [Candidatus Microgenomates bacterium]